MTRDMSWQERLETLLRDARLTGRKVEGKGDSYSKDWIPVGDEHVYSPHNDYRLAARTDVRPFTRQELTDHFGNSVVRFPRREGQAEIYRIQSLQVGCVELVADGYVRLTVPFDDLAKNWHFLRDGQDETSWPPCGVVVETPAKEYTTVLSSEVQVAPVQGLALRFGNDVVRVLAKVDDKWATIFHRGRIDASVDASDIMNALPTAQDELVAFSPETKAPPKLPKEITGVAKVVLTRAVAGLTGTDFDQYASVLARFILGWETGTDVTFPMLETPKPAPTCDACGNKLPHHDGRRCNAECDDREFGPVRPLPVDERWNNYMLTCDKATAFAIRKGLQESTFDQTCGLYKVNLSRKLVAQLLEMFDDSQDPAEAGDDQDALGVTEQTANSGEPSFKNLLTCVLIPNLRMMAKTSQQAAAMLEHCEGFLEDDGKPQAFHPVTRVQVDCGCETCWEAAHAHEPFPMRHMIVCPQCGNKRCPKAHYHGNACTGSNEPGQKGSSWEKVKPNGKGNMTSFQRLRELYGIIVASSARGYIGSGYLDELEAWLHANEPVPAPPAPEIPVHDPAVRPWYQEFDVDTAIGQEVWCPNNPATRAAMYRWITHHLNLAYRKGRQHGLAQHVPLEWLSIYAQHAGLKHVDEDDLHDALTDGRAGQAIQNWIDGIRDAERRWEHFGKLAANTLSRAIPEQSTEPLSPDRLLTLAENAGIAMRFLKEQLASADDTVTRMLCAVGFDVYGKGSEERPAVEKYGQMSDAIRGRYMEIVERWRECLNTLAAIVHAVGDNGELEIRRAIGSEPFPDPIWQDIKARVAAGFECQPDMRYPADAATSQAIEKALGTLEAVSPGAAVIGTDWHTMTNEEVLASLANKSPGVVFGKYWLPEEKPAPPTDEGPPPLIVVPHAHYHYAQGGETPMLGDRIECVAKVVLCTSHDEPDVIANPGDRFTVYELNTVVGAGVALRVNKPTGTIMPGHWGWADKFKLIERGQLENQ